MISDHLHSNNVRPRKLISAEARVPLNTTHFARTTLGAFHTMDQEKMQPAGFVSFDLLSLEGTYLFYELQKQPGPSSDNIHPPLTCSR